MKKNQEIIEALQEIQNNLKHLQGIHYELKEIRQIKQEKLNKQKG